MTSDDRQARDGRTRETLPPGLYRRGGSLLDAVLLDYELNRRGSIATARARLRILREAIGPRAAVTFATEDVQRLQVEWQRGGSRLGRSTGGAICSARRSDLLGAAGSSPASSTSLAWKSTRRAPSTSASARPRRSPSTCPSTHAIRSASRCSTGFARGSSPLPSAASSTSTAR